MGVKIVNAKLRREVFEALVSQLVRCSRSLHSHFLTARLMRAVELRTCLESLALHEHMLADLIRLNAYHAAIDRYVTPQDCVVDIGTGTGVLAFFAAAKKARKVYALDHSEPMLRLCQGRGRRQRDNQHELRRVKQPQVSTPGSD